MIKRFKVCVAYDGTNYKGWQKQNNGLGIQEVLEKVLSSISHEQIDIVASGRTDAGVHASKQYFHFDTVFYLDADAWHKAIRGYLPKDIYIISMEEVDQSFHARFSAKAKIYQYRIKINHYDVFERNYSCYCGYPLDVKVMKQCAQLFVGSKDFTSFCGNSLQIHPDQVRTIYSIDIEDNEEWIVLTFHGRSFLRYMVRMITAALITAGRGRVSEDELEMMLKAKNKDAFKLNAEPQGLYLMDVLYEG
ncbi:MAG: tRNA pseudouridine(38-40) synthase TruA [Erysipelotrichaceae bacterium]